MRVKRTHNIVQSQQLLNHTHLTYTQWLNNDIASNVLTTTCILHGRYMMEHVGSDIVPLPPEASFLSEKEKREMKQDIANTYDTSIDKLVADEQKKTPRSPPGQIRLEITNGMVYYMFYYVMQLQADIDPSLLWEPALLIPPLLWAFHTLRVKSSNMSFVLT